MIGRTIGEFIDELYNNPEMEFVYRDEHYMISGYIEPPDKNYTLELYNITKNVSLFKFTDKLREKCIENFENSKIFDKKNIYEVENEITILYG